MPQLNKSTGKGKGWHGESRRHSDAAKKGKDWYQEEPLYRTSRRLIKRGGSYSFSGTVPEQYLTPEEYYLDQKERGKTDKKILKQLKDEEKTLRKLTSSPDTSMSLKRDYADYYHTVHTRRKYIETRIKSK